MFGGVGGGEAAPGGVVVAVAEEFDAEVPPVCRTPVVWGSVILV